jgi:hypothetical protein
MPAAIGGIGVEMKDHEIWRAHRWDSVHNRQMILALGIGSDRQQTVLGLRERHRKSGGGE